ncbi:MAG: hypothetical protein ACW98F_18465 [Candidatus Hodarchaeales archaeon]|jgi:hypothetical protein
MTNLSNHLKNTVPYEPLLFDALVSEENGITEQHVRILASLFKLGGYTTLNILVTLVKFAQPTVSLRVQELEDYGYLRKNPEIIPTPIVLVLNPDDLRNRLSQRSKSQQNAINFLLKIDDEGIDYLSVQDTFIKAFRVLYPNDHTLAELLASTYIHTNISREKLFDFLNNRKRRPNKTYEELLSSCKDIFHVIHRKHKKSDINLRPRLPLNILLGYRKYYLNMLNDHYLSQLHLLEQYMLKEFDSFIPHQYLKFLSEIKAKVGICLRHYSQIKVINNNILEKKFPESNILELIGNRKEITPKHEISVLTTEEIKIPKAHERPQFKIRKINTPMKRDYSTRDFIIFENRGCLIIPERSESQPYYYIGPRFTATMNSFFNSKW